MPLPDLFRERQAVRIQVPNTGKESLTLTVLPYATVEDVLLHAVESRLAARVRGDMKPAEPIPFDLTQSITRVSIR